MAESFICSSKVSSKTTLIYGLIDPRTQELRYVGKTTLKPRQRLKTHRYAAREKGKKTYANAWITDLLRNGLDPELFIIDEIPPGDDWIAAEQFYIEYFRFIGAKLCNLSIGGEGATGYCHSPESIAKSIRRGSDNAAFGRPMPIATKIALLEGGRKLRADPVRYAEALKRQKAGRNQERLTRLLQSFCADPANESKINDMRARRAEAVRRANRARGKLSDGDIAEIRAALLRGERNGNIAAIFSISPSLVSQIKSGRRRKLNEQVSNAQPTI